MEHSINPWLGSRRHADRAKETNKATAAIAGIAGVVLSGFSAFWGACLGGHNPRAGEPFPDFEGIALFLIGVSVIPLGVAVIAALVRHYITSRFAAARVSIPFAILLLGPPVSLELGYSVQARKNHKMAQEMEFYAEQKVEYARYAAQVTTDPGIVLRERWYEKPSNVPWGASLSARQMVFDDSFCPDHFAVAYTGDQLREIAERAQDKRLLVVCHPNCPPDLIESLWPQVMASGQSQLTSRMIQNPATPKHLLEEHQAERLNSKRTNATWIDREIDEHLHQSNNIKNADKTRRGKR